MHRFAMTALKCKKVVFIHTVPICHSFAPWSSFRLLEPFYFRKFYVFLTSDLRSVYVTLNVDWALVCFCVFYPHSDIFELLRVCVPEVKIRENKKGKLLKSSYKRSAKRGTRFFLNPRPHLRGVTPRQFFLAAHYIVC